MSELNYQDFMKKVNDCLAKMSAEALRVLLTKWASEVQPARRHEFLDRLTISRSGLPMVIIVRVGLKKWINSF